MILLINDCSLAHERIEFSLQVRFGSQTASQSTCDCLAWRCEFSNPYFFQADTLIVMVTSAQYTEMLNFLTSELNGRGIDHKSNTWSKMVPARWRNSPYCLSINNSDSGNLSTPCVFQRRRHLMADTFSCPVGMRHKVRSIKEYKANMQSYEIWCTQQCDAQLKWTG